MSDEPRRLFTLQWVDVLSRDDLTGTAKLTLLVLADMQGDNREAVVSAATLARYIGVHRYSVLRALRELTEAGELETTKRFKHRKLADGSTVTSPRPSSYRVTKLRATPTDLKAILAGHVSQPGTAVSPSHVSQPASHVSQPASHVSQPASHNSTPDPDQDPDQGSDQGSGERRASARRPPVSTLLGAVWEALRDAWSSERGIKLGALRTRSRAEREALARFVDWLQSGPPAGSDELVGAAERAARAYLRTVEPALERRGWPLGFFVERAPALLAAASSSSNGRREPSAAERVDALERAIERASRNAESFRKQGAERTAETWEAQRASLESELLELSRRSGHRLAASARSNRSTSERGMHGRPLSSGTRT